MTKSRRTNAPHQEEYACEAGRTRLGENFKPDAYQTGASVSK